MPLVEANEEKGRYHWIWKEYIGDVVEENRRARAVKEKIGEGAMGRKIASIPTSVFRSWQEEFEKQGGKKQDNWTHDWKSFLWRKIQEHPQFRTVDKLLHVGPADGHVFVR